jgi:two-component system NtrC family sensor kinase
VNGLVERTLQLHEHSLRRNRIEVDFYPQSNLPGVIGDANQLIQVFLNLITNAEQAIHEVRENGRIQVRLARSGNRVSVTVQDDGVGIRPEILPKIFDPFYTTKRPGGGTGLGLSICMSIIREHGGTIEASPLPAGGSAFTVTLPCATEDLAKEVSPTSPTREASLAAAEPAPLAARSVLVLDDEESIRMLLEEGLSSNGMRVDSAATLAEALTLVGRNSYDAFLCDINLSAAGVAVDGRDIAGKVVAAAVSRKPILVYMTGDLLDNANGSRKPGEPRTLQKPFRISDVLALLNECFAAVPHESHSK